MMDGYGSDFEEGAAVAPGRKRDESRHDLAGTGPDGAGRKRPRGKMPSRRDFDEARDHSERVAYAKNNLIGMTAYERHVKYINDYVLYYGRGRAPAPPLQPARNDYDVIEEEHRFIWDERDQAVMTWEKELSRSYYDKLFKEYSVADLSRYREGKIALRWRTEQEVFQGLGQFTCGNLGCGARGPLQSWRVNFAYVERGERRSALVKLRLCAACSQKLNHKAPHAVAAHGDSAVGAAASDGKAAASDGKAADRRSKKAKRDRKHKHSRRKKDKGKRPSGDESPGTDPFHGMFQ